MKHLQPKKDHIGTAILCAVFGLICVMFAPVDAPGGPEVGIGGLVIGMLAAGYFLIRAHMQG